MNKTLSDEQIKVFWEGLSIQGLDECWHWIKGGLPSGYGLYNFNCTKEYAHRISYRLTHGEIKDNLFVLHSCDNPSITKDN